MNFRFFHFLYVIRHGRALRGAGWLEWQRAFHLEWTNVELELVPFMYVNRFYFSFFASGILMILINQRQFQHPMLSPFVLYSANRINNEFLINVRIKTKLNHSKTTTKYVQIYINSFFISFNGYYMLSVLCSVDLSHIYEISSRWQYQPSGWVGVLYTQPTSVRRSVNPKWSYMYIAKRCVMLLLLLCVYKLQTFWIHIFVF